MSSSSYVVRVYIHACACVAFSRQMATNDSCVQPCAQPSSPRLFIVTTDKIRRPLKKNYVDLATVHVVYTVTDCSGHFLSRNARASVDRLLKRKAR